MAETKKAKTANTIRRLTHIAFDDPASSNAAFGRRTASTMAHTAMAITDATKNNQKRAAKKAAIGYESPKKRPIAQPTSTTW
jgi:hypothetical protein